MSTIYVLVLVTFMGGGGKDMPQTYLTSFQEWSSEQKCKDALNFLNETTKNSFLMGKCSPK